MNQNAHILSKIDRVWFDSNRTANELHMTHSAHQAAVRSVKMAIRGTPRYGRQTETESFDLYGPCAVIVDLPDDSGKPFIFERRP